MTEGLLRAVSGWYPHVSQGNKEGITHSWTGHVVGVR